MLRDIRLRFWPTYYDCLRWSESGEIAILANEYVYLLVPSKEDSKRTKGTPQFRATRAELRSSGRDDVIINEPVSIYSIGEEQGPGHVKAVEWSPLGTSQRRGCMLAVLTTTHQLKVFQPEGHPANEWKVTHDISQALENHEDWDESVRDTRIQRLRSRSRSMAWSYKCEFAGMKWGQCLLAVANDNLEIALILVTHESCDITSVFRPRILEGPGFYTKMSWSPWRAVSQDKAESFLSVVHRGTVTLHKVSMVRERGGDMPVGTVVDEEEIHVIGGAVTEAHPILASTWYHRSIGGHWLFVYAIQHNIRAVAIQCEATEFVFGKTMHLWEFENSYMDPVSGLFTCPTPSASNSVEIHLSTILGNTQIVLWSLDLHKERTYGHSRRPVQVPQIEAQSSGKQSEQHWDYIIQERKQDFIAEWDINSATCKVWGIAKSPFAGIVAAVISLEPDDSLQYVTHSKETSRLLFGTRIQGRALVNMVYGKEKLPPVTNYSSESFITEFANLHDSDYTQPDVVGGAASGNSRTTAFEALKLTINAHCPTLDALVPLVNPKLAPELPNSALADALSHNIFDPSCLTALRLATCLRLFPQCRRDDGSLITPLHKDGPAIVAISITNILAAGRMLKFQDRLSQRVIYSAAMIGILGLWQFGSTVLQACREALSWLVSLNPELDFDLEEDFIAKAMASAESSGPGTEFMTEHQITLNDFEDKMIRCVMCDGRFKWEDLVIAECSGGHRYPRCGITYLPIQSGDAWKTCVICERNVLEIGQLDVAGSRADAKDSLVGLLLSAWDVCIHCGGRYC